MFRFLLYVRGYYSITVSGYGAERFINLCKIKNIYLWDLKMKQQEYSMKIAIADYQNLDDIIEKTGIKVDILKKYGLPFLFIGKENRIFYLAFLIIAIMLIFVSNLFVWKIEYKGNYTVSKEQLEDFLKENNISEGIFKSKVDYEILEKNLRKEFSIIKWCSVAISGNTLIVQIEENNLLKENEEIKEEFIYSDIVATTDGVVTNLMVRNGLAMVKIGDSVTKGQILVTGQIPIYDDSLLLKSYQYYDADADILIETVMETTESIDDVYYQKEYTGRTKKIPYLKIGEKDIRMSLKSSFAYYDTYTTMKQLSLFGLFKLPLYYGNYEAREYYLVEQKYEEEKVNEIFNEKLNNYYTSLSEKGVQILQKNVKIEHNANKWVMNGEFVVSVCNSDKQYRYQVENITE